jgi:hypothetical protein
MLCCITKRLSPLQQIRVENRLTCYATTQLKSVRNRQVWPRSTVAAKVAETKVSIASAGEVSWEVMGHLQTKKQSHVAWDHFHATSCASGRAALEQDIHGTLFRCLSIVILKWLTSGWATGVGSSTSPPRPYRLWGSPGLLYNRCR